VKSAIVINTFTGWQGDRNPGHLGADCSLLTKNVLAQGANRTSGAESERCYCGQHKDALMWSEGVGTECNRECVSAQADPDLDDRALRHDNIFADCLTNYYHRMAAVGPTANVCHTSIAGCDWHSVYTWVHTIRYKYRTLSEGF